MEPSSETIETPDMNRIVADAVRGVLLGATFTLQIPEPKTPRQPVKDPSPLTLSVIITGTGDIPIQSWRKFPGESVTDAKAWLTAAANEMFDTILSNEEICQYTGLPQPPTTPAQ